VLSLIPISDANPARRIPFVTLALIALNVVAFVQTPDLGTGSEAGVYFFETAPIPCQFQDECPNASIQLDAAGTTVTIPDRDLGSFLWSVIFSTFLHGGLLHIGGNMLFLWIFGNNVEDYLGHVKYLLFYLAGGLAASFAHIFTHIDSIIPSVGASGAVAAVMGAYILLFPHARVKVLLPIFVFITVVQMSAVAVLGIWFLYQFLIGAQELTGATDIAWMAHVGGFVFGVAAIYLLGGRPHRATTPLWYSGR
jgi:membrane associated rhomboid family serine protease